MLRYTKVGKVVMMMLWLIGLNTIKRLSALKFSLPGLLVNEERGKNDLSDVFLQHRAVIHELLYKHCISLRSPAKQRSRCAFPLLEGNRRALFEENNPNHHVIGRGCVLLLENGQRKEGGKEKDWRRTESMRDLNGYSDSDFAVYALVNTSKKKRKRETGNINLLPEKKTRTSYFVIL